MIQQHIRQHGAAVTRFVVTDTFTEFFKSNPTGVYKAEKEEGGWLHAVVLVGYNNTGKYWIVRNSWGDDWGDGGYFRITYDSYRATGIGAGDFTYGLIYDIKSASSATSGGLQLPAVEVDPDYAGCYLLRVPAAGSGIPNLYLSQIADLFGLGLKLPDLIQNNTQRGLFEFADEEKLLPIVDEPMNGKTVQLCFKGK